jgi:hypothetical protein
LLLHQFLNLPADTRLLSFFVQAPGCPKAVGVLGSSSHTVLQLEALLLHQFLNLPADTRLLSYFVQAPGCPKAVGVPGSSSHTVLQLEVLLEQHHQHCQLQLQPHVGDFVEGLAVWLRGIAGMARAVPRLLQHLHLQVRLVVMSTVVSGG